MLVNYFYTKSIYLGKEHHILRLSSQDEFGKELAPFTIHMRNLISEGKSNNSLKKSGTANANFLDYFQEGIKHIDHNAIEINYLFRSYHSFLTAGTSSSNEIVRKICEVKSSPMVSVGTSKNYHACIIPLLKDLASIQETYDEYIENGLYTEHPETSNLIECLNKITPRKIKVYDNEKCATRKHATPRTASTGEKSSRESYTSHIPYEDNFEKPIEEHQFFPLEKISELIENATSYRNACLYSLIAATGARDSEADQIQWKDIDLATRQILLIDPNNRSKPGEAYRGISELQKNKLEWKGRGTPLTVLLEPYGSYFFSYLELYLQHEYQSACGHNFVFHVKDGYPLYLSDYSSVILHQFKRAAAKTLPDQPHIVQKLGLHSLRHSYIYFMKNYIEHSNGQGLTDSELILLTGHTDIRSIQKYGKADRELMLEKISHANLLRKNGNIKSNTEFQIQYLEERLAIFKEQLHKQNKGVK